jgi:hypothetical protein
MRMPMPGAVCVMASGARQNVAKDQWQRTEKNHPESHSTLHLCDHQSIAIFPRHNDPSNQVEQDTASAQKYKRYRYHADQHRIHIEVSSKSRANSGNLLVLSDSDETLDRIGHWRILCAVILVDNGDEMAIRNTREPRHSFSGEFARLMLPGVVESSTAVL